MLETMKNRFESTVTKLSHAVRPPVTPGKLDHLDREAVARRRAGEALRHRVVTNQFRSA